MDVLVAGKILGTHNLKGEVKLVSHISNLTTIVGNKIMLSLEDGKDLIVTVKNLVHLRGDRWIISFEEINNKNDAIKLRNASIKLRKDILGIAKDEHLMAELIGMQAIDIINNLNLGKVVEIFETSAHDIYVIRDDEYETMVPDVSEFIKKIDYDKKQIEMEIIEGMREKIR